MKWDCKQFWFGKSKKKLHFVSLYFFFAFFWIKIWFQKINNDKFLVPKLLKAISAHCQFCCMARCSHNEGIEQNVGELVLVQMYLRCNNFAQWLHKAWWYTICIFINRTVDNPWVYQASNHCTRNMTLLIFQNSQLKMQFILTSFLGY